MSDPISKSLPSSQPVASAPTSAPSSKQDQEYKLRLQLQGSTSPTLMGNGESGLFPTTTEETGDFSSNNTFRLGMAIDWRKPLSSKLALYGGFHGGLSQTKANTDSELSLGGLTILDAGVQGSMNFLPNQKVFSPEIGIGMSVVGAVNGQAVNLDGVSPLPMRGVGVGLEAFVTPIKVPLWEGGGLAFTAYGKTLTVPKAGPGPTETDSRDFSDLNYSQAEVGLRIGAFLHKGKITPGGTEYVNTCEDDVAAIARQEKSIQELQSAQSILTAALGEMRFYLEKDSKHPFTSENMVHALRLGSVAQSLNSKGVDAKKIQAMVKEATKTKDPIKLPAVIASQTGVTVEEAKKYLEFAMVEYPEKYDFWKAPEEIAFEINPNLPQNPTGEFCSEIQQYRDQLETTIGLMQERKGHIDSLYKTAVHLAGLFIGEETTKEILSATVINIDTPSFKSGLPKQTHLDQLKGGTSMDTIAKQVFSVPEHEMPKLDQLANWLNGKIDYLPGEERTREILKNELGNQASSQPVETLETMREFHKKLGLGIFGHTDSDKDDKFNQELSERRAEFIRLYLISRGVDGSRLTAKGFGEKYPAMPENKGNPTERIIAKGKNRRVEFVPIGIDKPITPSAAQNPEHVDSKEVKKDEGGTTGSEVKTPKKKKKSNDTSKTDTSKKPPKVDKPK